MSDVPPPLDIEGIAPTPPENNKEEVLKRCQYHWEEWLKAVSELQEMNTVQGGERPFQMMNGMFDPYNWMRGDKAWDESSQIVINAEWKI